MKRKFIATLIAVSMCLNSISPTMFAHNADYSQKTDDEKVSQEENGLSEGDLNEDQVDTISTDDEVVIEDGEGQNSSDEQSDITDVKEDETSKETEESPDKLEENKESDDSNQLEESEDVTEDTTEDEPLEDSNEEHKEETDSLDEAVLDEETEDEEAKQVEEFIPAGEVAVDGVEPLEPLTGELIAPNSLEDNVIVVKGIGFSLGGDIDGDGKFDYDEERFRIVFNEEEKRINLVGQDGRYFHLTSDPYLTLTLFDAQGREKESVTILGTDPSTTKKLDVFQGLAYEEGDYLYVWHKFSESKLNVTNAVNSINGSEINDEIKQENLIDLTQGVDQDISDSKEEYRFRLDERGLQLVQNEKPVISNLTPISVLRGESIDVTDSLIITDDIDSLDLADIEVDESTFNVNEIGTHEIEMTITDKWGLSSNVVKRQLDVLKRSNIEEVNIVVNELFSIGFDDVTKQFIVKGDTTTDIIEGDNSTYLTLTVYDDEHNLKNRFEFNADASLNKVVFDELNEFIYSEGDWLSIDTKHPKDIKITGTMATELDSYQGLTPEDYSDGIDDIDFIENVRFNITGGELVSRYNYGPTFSEVTDLTIARGEDVNILDGIIVIDDHDGDISHQVKSDYVTGTNNIQGTHLITYQITDSWGRTAKTTRNLHVTNLSGIEENELELSINDETLLTMNVDSIKMSLTFDYNRRLYRTGTPSDTAFRITIFDSQWNEVVKFSIMNEQTVRQEMVDILSDLKLEYGMKMHVYAADMDQVKLTGPMTRPDFSLPNDFSDGFATTEMMTNTYFEFTKNGLIELYNNSPIINGLSDVELLVGTTDFNWLEGVSVEDDLDAVIGEHVYDLTYDASSLDVLTIGEYLVEYSAVDKLGDVTTEQRKITVVPPLRQNEIMVVDEVGNPYFSIGFDEYGESFTVSLNEGMKVSEMLNSGAYFNFEVYTPNNELLKIIEISSFDDLSALQELENVTYQDNYQFAIETNVAQQVRVMDELIKDPLITEDSYEDGVDNPDFIDNVRFINNQKQLEVVYNQAPTIEIDADVELEFYMGERIDYKEGVIVTDVDSVVNEENIKIFMYDDQGELILDDSLEPKELVEESRDMFSEPGEYTLLYVVTDAWGRTANATRTVTVHHGMLRNIFAFSAINGKINVPDAAHIGFTVNEAGEIRTQYTRNLMTQDEFGTGDRSIHLLDIRDSEGNSKLGGWFRLAGLTPLGGATAEALDNILLEEGDTIHFSSDQGKGNKIYGEMYNTGNEYSGGIAQTYQTQMAGFTITKYGLIENEIEPEAVAPGENEVWIDFYGIYDGGIVSRMKIDLNTDPDGDDPLGVLVNVEGAKSTDGFTISGFYQMSSSVLYNSTIFTMKHLTESGTQKMASTLTGRRGYNIFSHYSTAIAGASAKLKHGDYYTMVLNTALLDDAGENVSEYFINNIRIYGDVIYPENFTDDFADGIDSVDHINHSRLTFTKEGLVVDYNEPPVVNGADDMTLIVGSTFDPLEGVTFTDDKGVSSSEVVSNNVNTSVAGEYQVVYRVTDILNRVTEVTRTVTVRDSIYFNKINVFQQDDLENEIFTIYVDDLLNTYEAIVNFEGRLAQNSSVSEAFSIEIYDKDQLLKYSKSLRGNEMITDNTFNELSDVTYEDGDFIQLYKHSVDGSIETLKIEGSIVSEREDYTDGIQEPNNLYQVALKANRVTGFESFYNEAPVINGLTDLEFYRDPSGTIDDLFVAIEGIVTISDTHDGAIDIRSFELINAPDFTRTGEYETTFSITDSQGHTATQTVTISVLSNILKNVINVFGTAEEKFEIGFTRDQKFNVTNRSDNTIDHRLRVNLFNRFNELVESVDLTSDDTANAQKLQALTEVAYENQYYLMFETSIDNQVRIEGPVVTGYDDSGNEIYTTMFENGVKVEELNAYRFYITESGLHIVERATDILIDGLTPISVVRGDVTANLFEGITITHPNETHKADALFIEEFDLYEEGVQTVKYVLIDSWGTRFEKTREITVTQRQDVERNIIEVKNPSTGDVVFEIKMDTINLTFRTKKISDVALEETFTFSLYNDEHKLIKSIEINNDNLDSSLTEIEKLTFAYDDMIDIKSTNIKDGFAIQGMIQNQLEDYTDGVDNPDYLENVRFIIDTSYFTSQYNEAPVINGVEATTVFVGITFDPFEGVTVSDDLDGVISTDKVTVEGEIDMREYEPQILTYKVSDSWGRSTTITREITVRSRIENVNFDFYSKQNNTDKLMSFTFDSDKLQIEVTGSQLGEVLDATRPTDTLFIVEVFRNNDSIKSIELTGQSDSNALNALNYFPFEYGDMIEISLGNSITPTSPLYTKDMFRISGEMVTDELITEDYSQGIENSDFIDNVRFVINDSDVEAVYNEAPVLSFTKELTDSTIEKDKSHDITTYNLTEGFVATDDFDELDIAELIIVHKASQEPISDESLAEILTYELEFYILDHWGRKSNSIFLDLKLRPAINKTEIQLSRITEQFPDSDEYLTRPNELLASLTLEHVDEFGGTFKVEYDEFHPGMSKPLIDSVSYSETMYSIEHIPVDGPSSKIIFNTNDTMAAKIDQFTQTFTTFKYGDVLKFVTVEGPNLAIQGPVVHALEDYSDGVHDATKLIYTEFVITYDGLVATESVQRYSEYDSIQLFTQSNGFLGFNLALNTDTKRFEFTNVKPQNVTEINQMYLDDNHVKLNYDYFAKENTQIVKITHHSASSATESLTINSQSNFNQVFDFFNHRPFEFGDYITFELKDTRGRNQNLNLVPGDIYHGVGEDVVIEGIGDLDYSDGVSKENLAGFNATKFEITETGLTGEYNSAAIITGDFVVLDYGEAFDPMDGMNAYDNDPWDASISVADIVIESNPVNVLMPGAYEVLYSVTDTRGRTEYYTRFVFIRGIPLATYPQGQDVVLELNSITDIDEYLRSIIHISDYEDGVITHLAEITTEFDPTKVGVYGVHYAAVDTYGSHNEFNMTVEVVKTINVSVPVNNHIPFQIVTNLVESDDPFVSGLISLQNHNMYSEVDVSVDSFTSLNSANSLKIVAPESEDWSTLSREESMQKMALGIYPKHNVADITKENPLWLTDGMNAMQYVGTIPNAVDETTSTTERFSFTALHGKEFQGGTSTGRYELVLRFE